MAYKLAEEDKLCGVIYPTYEGFSPIPKATCEMLESKCEQTIIVKCKDNQSEEDKKPESQSGSVSACQSLLVKVTLPQKVKLLLLNQLVNLHLQDQLAQVNLLHSQSQLV